MAISASTAVGVAVSNTTAQFLAAGVGGTGPYTYQWYIAAGTTITPGGGNIVSGATAASQTLSGLTANTVYTAAVIVTDTIPNTATIKITFQTLAGAVVGASSTAPVGGVFVNTDGNILNASGVGQGFSYLYNSPLVRAEAGSLSTGAPGPTGYPPTSGPQADFNTVRAALALLINTSVITQTTGPTSPTPANLP